MRTGVLGAEQISSIGFFEVLFLAVDAFHQVAQTIDLKLPSCDSLERLNKILKLYHGEFQPVLFKKFAPAIAAIVPTSAAATR